MFSGMIDRNSETHLNGASAGDPVSALLMGMRLRGASYGKLRLAPPFGIRFPEAAEARFHFVAFGSAHLQQEDGETRELSCGDAVLLPRGDDHSLVSAPGVPVRPVGSFEAAPLCANVCAIDDHPEQPCRTSEALIFTGRMQFELDTLHPLVGLMPRVMSVGALLGREPEIMTLLAVMEREMAAERAGSAGILARLADVVAATIVRGWVECGCGNAAGWVEALRDPQLGRVLAALHRDPGRDWTVGEMAAEMGRSRSVFAERFVTATGMTPLRYVAVLRMRLAEQWIGRDRMAIDTAARRLGYGSQAAFARAYKRVTGQSPGSARRAAPSSEAPAAIGL